MVREPEAETQIEASGDAIIIAEALHAIASALREYTRAMNDDGEPEKPENYLDGTPVG